MAGGCVGLWGGPLAGAEAGDAGVAGGGGGGWCRPAWVHRRIRGYTVPVHILTHTLVGAHSGHIPVHMMRWDRATYYRYAALLGLARGRHLSVHLQ